MNPLRWLLLAASGNRWLREGAPRYGFVRRAVSRFMPGERLEDALAAAAALRPSGIPAILTQLGENVADRAEAEAVTRHYLQVLDQVADAEGDCEISVKPTQLGLDLDPGLCRDNLIRLVEHAATRRNYVWIDMEQTRYVDATLELTRAGRSAGSNVGVCLQAYLRRTRDDLAALVPTGAGVRLVKGAYNEPPALAFKRKRDVDANYFELARTLLGEEARRAGVRAVFGTHDPKLIRAIREHTAAAGLPAAAGEFHLLYGIQRATQERLVSEAVPVRVLISYGSYWFPWYMRRLAERPANVLFVLKSVFRS